MTPDYIRILRPALLVLMMLIILAYTVTSCIIRCSRNEVEWGKYRTVIRQAEDLNKGRVSDGD